jgi:hypothetical protein
MPALAASLEGVAQRSYGMVASLFESLSLQHQRLLRGAAV